jgi:hypothetical protein
MFIEILTSDGKLLVNKQSVVTMQYFNKTDYTAIELVSGTTLRATGDVRQVFLKGPQLVNN